MKVWGVIYVITCLLNGMKYVGQTTRPINLRISEHKHGNQYIDRAIQKHGLENFIIEVNDLPEEKVEKNHVYRLIYSMYIRYTNIYNWKI